jgi:hypothetical protein
MAIKAVNFNENDEDEAELRTLLQIVSDKGLKALTIDELSKLGTLLEAKEYGDDKKAHKSKKKLLKQINSAMYDIHKTRRFFL